MWNYIHYTAMSSSEERNVYLWMVPWVYDNSWIRSYILPQEPGRITVLLKIKTKIRKKAEWCSSGNQLDPYSCQLKKKIFIYGKQSGIIENRPYGISKFNFIQYVPNIYVYIFFCSFAPIKNLFWQCWGHPAVLFKTPNCSIIDTTKPYKKL